MENVVRLVPPLGDRRDARPGAEPLWREALGRELRAERARRQERISDVAARAGVSPQYLSELERGKKDPSSEILAAVAGALEVTVLQLARSVSADAARPVRTLSGPVCLAA